MFSLNETHLELQSAARRLAVDVIAGRAAEVDRSEAYPWHNVEN
jgi:3-sulfinopropanoyl-CoA desulfinase